MRGLGLGLVIVAVLLGAPLTSASAADQPLPQIPGLTARDMFPGGCVDCHRNRPDIKRDFRLSTHIEKWTRKVDPVVLARVRAITPKSIKLAGKHPPMDKKSFRSVPANCDPCHANVKAKIPQMGPMMHALHLTGGKANHYLTRYKGTCAYCHKYDRTTGRWKIPSLPER